MYYTRWNISRSQAKARDEEVEKLNARTVEDDMKDASLEELEELEDELDDDGMLEKYREQASSRRDCVRTTFIVQ